MRTSSTRGRGLPRRAAFLLVTLLAALPAAAAGQDASVLGRGVALGASGLRLGGYLAIDWEKPSQGDATVTFDDLSLFVFGDLTPRVRVFAEVEDSKFWQVSGGRSRVEHHGDLERLYVEYLHSDVVKIRAGKFLTPVGTWNEVHPDPLTWTVNRPLASYATFPTFLTGLLASGTIDRERGDIEYDLFAQANPCLDCNTNDRQTERAIGGRLRWHATHGEVGVPVLHYVDRLTRDAVTLSGVHAVAHRDRLDVRGEATIGRVTSATGDAGSEFAWYVQGVWALTDRHFLVAQAERARSARDETWRAWTAGVLVRPKPGLSLKLDYQQRRGLFPVEEAGSGNRVLASFGVLF